MYSLACESAAEESKTKQSALAATRSLGRRISQRPPSLRGYRRRGGKPQAALTGGMPTAPFHASPCAARCMRARSLLSCPHAAISTHNTQHHTQHLTHGAPSLHISACEPATPATQKHARRTQEARPRAERMPQKDKGVAQHRSATKAQLRSAITHVQQSSKQS